MSETDIFINNSIYPNAKDVFKLKVKSIEEVKEKCIFVIDTNALLMPYTASSDSIEQIKQVYSKLVAQKRLIIPGQVSREFAKNRPEKIKDIFQQLNDEKSKIHKVSTKIYPLLEDIQEYEDALDIEQKINALIKEYGNKISSLQDQIRYWTWNDPVSSIYNQLFTDEIIFDLQLDENKKVEIGKELTRRYEYKIPPGYKDAGKLDAGIGDLLIWYTILDVAKTKDCDIIFVSGDEKTDWFYQSTGQSLYPRFELVMEFSQATKMRSFHIVKFSEFLNLQGVTEQVIKEVTKIEEIQKSNRWVDEIIEAIKSLGGKAKLSDIYDQIESTTTRDLPENWTATVRYTIQMHSSDSETYKGGQDLFRRIDRGYWALADYLSAHDEMTSEIDTQTAS